MCVDKVCVHNHKRTVNHKSDKTMPRIRSVLFFLFIWLKDMFHCWVCAGNGHLNAEEDNGYY